MNILFVITIIVIVIGILLLLLSYRDKTRLGLLRKKVVYKDTSLEPGLILESKSINLRGKPDYLIREGNTIIPVEVKTGRTPQSPYQSHIMQLMAYCYLVEENYNIRPPGGYIKYPEREFKIAYTKEAEESVHTIVEEIISMKGTRKELHCKHSSHYV